MWRNLLIESHRSGQKLFETAFDCNDCNSDYPLCNRTAWINHRKWSAIRNQRNLWVCTMACDDAVCRIYAVYRNDWNALGIRAGVYAWNFRCGI